MLLIAGVLLARAMYLILRGESLHDVTMGAGEGIVSAATFLAVAPIVPGPLFVGLVAAVAATVAVRWAWRTVFEDVGASLDDMFRAQFPHLRSYYPLLSTC